MPGAKSPEAEYVAARRVLLDALEALGKHRKAVVLVGAQAIYLHVGEGDLALSPYTTDGDLAIDPRKLDDRPDLTEALEAAGFELAMRPGSWTMAEVRIDLMVAASLGGPGRRGARLGVHGNEVARKAAGLEAAMVDCVPVRLAALDSADDRAIDVSVAGVASLLIAKLHKITERKTTPDRLQDKDGLDILRLLRFADTGTLSRTLTKLELHPIAGDVTRLCTRNGKRRSANASRREPNSRRPRPDSPLPRLARISARSPMYSGAYGHTAISNDRSRS